MPRNTRNLYVLAKILSGQTYMTTADIAQLANECQCTTRSIYHTLADIRQHMPAEYWEGSI